MDRHLLPLSVSFQPGLLNILVMTWLAIGGQVVRAAYGLVVLRGQFVLPATGATFDLLRLHFKVDHTEGGQDNIQTLGTMLMHVVLG